MLQRAKTGRSMELTLHFVPNLPALDQPLPAEIQVLLDGRRAERPQLGLGRGAAFISEVVLECV